MKMTEDQYRLHCEDYDGYCETCDKVTRFGLTEPDAEEYECPDCEQSACCGIEQALIAGMIEIVTEDELLNEDEELSEEVEDEL